MSWLRYPASGLLLGAILVLSSPVGRVVADENKPAKTNAVLKDSALAKVPADAAFFASSLHNKEQLDLFTRSQAYKHLRKIPIVELAGKAVMAKLADEDSPFRPLFDLLGKKDDKENKQAAENAELVELLLGSASDEIFVYGGKGWVDLMNVNSKASSASRTGVLGALLSGDFFAFQKAGSKEMFLELQKHRKLLDVPDLIVGVKAKDAKKLDAHLKRLEPELKKLAGQHPLFKDRVKREGNFLTLQLDGSQIPWDDIDLTMFVDKKEDLDDLVKHLKKATLAISIGVKEGYLLFALTSSVKDLEKFGKGDSLGGRKELQPLARQTNKVTIVGYASKDYLESTVGATDWDATGKEAKKLVEKNVKKADLKKSIDKDIDGLFAELKKWNTGRGTLVAYNTLTKDGYEAFIHDYAKHDHLKGINTKLLEHVDGEPIFATAFGFTVDGTTAATLSKYARAFYGHGETIFLDLDLDANAKDEYKRISGILLPALRELDDTFQKKLIPSVKGQSGLGLVIDARWKSKKWQTDMPAAKKPLPMIELGLLLGVNDGDKFADAMKDMRIGANKLLGKIGEATMLPIPIKLEEPKKHAGKSITLYTWELPKDLGLDEQVVPTAATSKKVVAIALSKAHAERLIAPTKLKLVSGPLTVKRDLIGGTVFNMKPLVALVTAWADAAPDLVPGDDDTAKFVRKQVADTARQVKQIGTVLECVKQVQSATYLDDGKVTTQIRLVVKDLEETPEPPGKK